MPLDGNAEAEVEITPEHIGKVTIGDTARIKFTAFPFQKYGTVDGNVRYISGDTFSRQNQEGMPEDKAAYYMAKISFNRNSDTNEYKSGIFIIPGMEVQAEIVVGRRRILEYIIYPLIKSFDEAMREP